MGEAGEPWGMPVVIGHCWSVRPWNDTAVDLLVRKEALHDMMGAGQPRWRRVWRSRSEDTLSNAPQTSRKSADEVRFLDFAISTSWTNAITASIADLWGLPPIWSGWRRLWDSEPETATSPTAMEEMTMQLTHVQHDIQDVRDAIRNPPGKRKQGTSYQDNEPTMPMNR
jgi:hypothetical protein